MFCQHLAILLQEFVQELVVLKYICPHVLGEIRHPSKNTANVNNEPKCPHGSEHKGTLLT